MRAARPYDVAADGRFLMNVPTEDATAAPIIQEINASPLRETVPASSLALCCEPMPRTVRAIDGAAKKGGDSIESVAIPAAGHFVFIDPEHFQFHLVSRRFVREAVIGSHQKGAPGDPDHARGRLL